MRLLTKSFSAIVISVFLIACIDEFRTEQQLHLDGETIDEASVDQIVHQEHFNINLVADLTNRIDDNKYHKPLHDTVLINSISNLFYPDIVTHKRLANQKDILRFQLVSSAQGESVNGLEINLNKFTTQKARIDYLVHTDAYRKELKHFQEEIAKEYAKNSTAHSGDPYRLFEHELIAANTISGENRRSAGGKAIVETHRNVLILLTDGYIEYGAYNKADCKGNKCRYMHGPRITELRKLMNASSVTPEEFMNTTDYGLIPAVNPVLAEYEVLILEFYDRSLSKVGSSTVFPTDFEITKAVWEKWLKDSGVKRVEIHKVANHPNQVKTIVKQFLGLEG